MQFKRRLLVPVLLLLQCSITIAQSGRKFWRQSGQRIGCELAWRVAFQTANTSRRAPMLILSAIGAADPIR
jgi:hypothetical protein